MVEVVVSDVMRIFDDFCDVHDVMSKMSINVRVVSDFSNIDAVDQKLPLTDFSEKASSIKFFVVFLGIVSYRLL